MSRGAEEDDDSGEEPGDYAPESDEAGELWCPKCGAVMYADATLCPRCGDFVTPGLRPASSMPAWMWVGLGILALLILAGLAASLLR